MIKSLEIPSTYKVKKLNSMNYRINKSNKSNKNIIEPNNYHLKEKILFKNMDKNIP